MNEICRDVKNDIERKEHKKEKESRKEWSEVQEVGRKKEKE